MNLSHSTVIAIGIICVTIIIVGVPLLIFFIRAFPNIKVKTKFGEVALNEKDDKQVEETDVDRINTCLGLHCNPQKINIITMKIMDTAIRIAYIKNMDIVSEQDKYLKQKIILMRDIDTKSYLRLLKEKFLDSKILEKHSEDYKIYKTTANFIYSELDSYFSKVIFENHIEAKEGRDWENYKDINILSFLSGMNEVMDMSYPSILCIKRPDWDLEYQNYVIPRLKVEMNDVFEQFRRISVEKNREISTLRRDLDKFLGSFCHSITLEGGENGN